MAFISADSRRMTLVDARTLTVRKTVALAAKKADGSALDGEGPQLVNERDRDMVARIDLARGVVTGEWPTTGCSQPTGMAVDQEHHRAFIGCRSNTPVLVVMDTRSGAIVQTLPLGRGNDAAAYDPLRRRGHCQKDRTDWRVENGGVGQVDASPAQTG